MLLWIFLCLMVMLVQADLFVSNVTGVDAPGCGHAYNACATLNYTIMNVAAAGDAIHVDGGNGSGARVSYMIDNLSIRMPLSIIGFGVTRPLLICRNVADFGLTLTTSSYFIARFLHFTHCKDAINRI